MKAALLFIVSLAAFLLAIVLNPIIFIFVFLLTIYSGLMFSKSWNDRIFRSDLHLIISIAAVLAAVLYFAFLSP